MVCLRLKGPLVDLRSALGGKVGMRSREQEHMTDLTGKVGGRLIAVLTVLMPRSIATFCLVLMSESESESASSVGALTLIDAPERRSAKWMVWKALAVERA